MLREEFARLLQEARSQTLSLVDGLTDEQMIGPELPIVNPPVWEIGHVAWFQERWALRELRELPPLRSDADALYDSAAIAHHLRWDRPLPSRAETLVRVDEVLESVMEHLGSSVVSEAETYFHLLVLYHEYMHAEALAYTRQTLGYSPPPPNPNPSTGSAQTLSGQGEGPATAPSSVLSPLASVPFAQPSVPGDQPSALTTQSPVLTDVEIPGGTFWLGATPDEPFVFDNEKWAHPVEVQPYRMARTAVTNAEFAAFADDGGYADQRLWSAAGWRWRVESNAEHPVYWRREAPGRWLRRHYDRWVALEPNLPVLHVCWFEADAYCRWAGRRLPTEAEWEFAASAEPDGTGWHKRRFPWGDKPPTTSRANLDWLRGGCIEADALPEGDSFFGCRQMLGNLWEWTADDFLPFPGFVVDPYREYSEPWFRTHKVLRGGCWATRTHLIRNTWRNFYPPNRRDVWAGFRTCALKAAQR